MIVYDFRDEVKVRAKELINWILTSGSEVKLGLTKDDVIQGDISKRSVRAMSATNRAEIWAKRYQQQNYQSWSTPVGKVTILKINFIITKNFVFVAI